VAHGGGVVRVSPLRQSDAFPKLDLVAAVDPVGVETLDASDDVLRQVADALNRDLGRVRGRGWIVVVDAVAGRILSRLDRAAIQACASAAYGAIDGLGGDFLEAKLNDDRSRLYATLCGAHTNLVLTLERPRPRGSGRGRMGVMLVDNLMTLEKSFQGWASRVWRAVPVRIRWEWRGSLPDCMAELFDEIGARPSRRDLSLVGMEAGERFWTRVSRTLKRPFAEEFAANCEWAEIPGSDRLSMLLPEPVSQQLRFERGSMEEFQGVVADLLDLQARISPFGSKPIFGGDPITAVQVPSDGLGPLVASQLEILPQAGELIERLVVWSGALGTEVRGYSGNRLGDEVFGPVVLRFRHRPRRPSGHEAMAATDRVSSYFASNGIIDLDATLALLAARPEDA
jgi:hypothetical protein